jgi:cyclophilin family peptidyl-prolyl cis-trans isomerase
MKASLRAGFVLGVLLFTGCTHHPATTANRAPVPRGDSALTGAPPPPIDSMKSYPRAKLVALPGQPIPASRNPPPPSPGPIVPAGFSSLPPTTPTEAPATTVTTEPPAASGSSSPDASQAAAQAPSPAASDSGMNVSPPPMPADTANAAPGEVGAASTPNPGSVIESPENSEVAVVETSLGKIVIELDDFAAPKTCKNFRELIADGFYNNTVFHRVIPNFIIQGGDPKSKSAASDRNSYGLGSPGYTIPAEIALKHDRGAVGMARLPDSLNPSRESNGSQFYICLGPCPSLDDAYTVFGHVIQGLDVAEKIAAQPRDARDNPLQRIEMTVSLQPKDQAMANASTASP